MALIDLYIAEEKRIAALKLKVPAWKYIWVIFYTLGGMATGQIIPNNQKPGILGHAPMPYPALFFILFLFFAIGCVILGSLI